jgi:hypothetical protein
MSEEKKFDFMSLNEDDSTIVEQPIEETVEVEQEETEVETETEETDETTSEEVETEEEPAKKEPQKKTPKPVYTKEELRQLLKGGEFDSIDTSRLSEEGQLVMRAFQSGLTPKLQEAAELRKELERLKQSVEEAKPKPAPKDIYEAYDQDPEGVFGYINTEIKKLVADDSRESIVAIEQLRDLKESLRQRDVQKVKQESIAAQEQSKVITALTQAVPDIMTKQSALKDFALEYLGYTPEDLAFETDLGRHGIAAVRAVSRINSAYERFNATKTVKQKEKTKKPTTVESPGKGFDKQEVSKKELLQQAKKTGDWRTYLMELDD